MHRQAKVGTTVEMQQQGKVGYHIQISYLKVDVPCPNSRPSPSDPLRCLATYLPR